MGKKLKESGNKIKKNINKCSVTIRFSEQENKNVKNTVMDILVNSFETRLKDYISSH